jgi:clan AA aspartic protease
VAITGTVEGREALIPLTLLGPDDNRVRFEAIVDTGFTGHLVLPPAVVAELNLPLRGSRDSFLADGSVVSLDAYRAGVEWEDRVRVVPALAAEGGPLAGMSLLRGSELRIEVVDGGGVVIRPLP